MRYRIVLLAAVIAAAAYTTSANAGTQLCVYPISTTVYGATVTASFSVTCDQTKVSLIAVSYQPGGSVLSRSVSGTFAVGVQSLQVTVDCGNGETDLLLGEPMLNAPPDRDVRAEAYKVACVTPAPPTVVYVDRLVEVVKTVYVDRPVDRVVDRVVPGPTVTVPGPTVYVALPPEVKTVKVPGKRVVKVVYRDRWHTRTVKVKAKPLVRTRIVYRDSPPKIKWRTQWKTKYVTTLLETCNGHAKIPGNG